ncbi:uncharacterized protein LOC128322172 [Hemicordylus capensis]|uniref:uncharacterized protein LOC128322172 n=1 Tax=Hemicordylus capensis TaxID=884348 RepID=UPI002303C391|nr:uncharacterized protein LOC128322172 [Hemicordylus capensis]
MAVPGNQVYTSCLPFGEPHQKLLITILIFLGLFALLEHALKTITLFWINLTPFLKRVYDACFKKGGSLLKSIRVLSSSKRLWKNSVLIKGRKKLSTLRFRCVVDPVKITVKMGTTNKPSSLQGSRKSKACCFGTWPGLQDAADKKASWSKSQQQRRNSQCSSQPSDTETPQPACPAGSVASWVRFSFNSPECERLAESSSARYGSLARNHQRATGDKPHSLEVAGERVQGQRFLQRSVGLNTQESGARHSEHPHEHLNRQSSETNFIPSPILPGPRRVVYSALASDTISRTHLNSEEYSYPHSPRGPQRRLGLEWHQCLPAAQQAEVYVYLVSPPPPSPEHNSEQINHPFSASQTTSGKDVLANRISFSQSRGSSSQGPAGQGNCETQKQRKSIWERKHQRRSLLPNSDYEKLAGSSAGTSLGHNEPFPHNSPLLADRGRGGLDVVPPTIAS